VSPIPLTSHPSWGYGPYMTRKPKPSGRSKGSSYTISGVYCPSTGKVSYGSELMAKIALARLKAFRPRLQSVYLCPAPQCKQWHLSSQVPNNKKETV
jgi:hypothetical protein